MTSARAASILMAGFLISAATANASLLTYDLTIVADPGSGSISVGQGQLVYDTSLAQHVGAFTFVAPTVGLLSLNIDVLDSHLNLANAVNGPNMPTLYLDPITLKPANFELWGAWGNTSTTDGPGFQFARGFEYDPAAHSYYAARSGDGSSVVGATPAPGTPNSVEGSVIYSLVAPEPASIFLLCIPFWLIAARVAQKRPKQS